jgi:hypothetical protein
VGLTSECLQYVGKLVVARPVYGWGWSFGADSPFSDYGQIDAIGDFHVRVSEFCWLDGEMRGAIGLIEELDCAIDGSLIEFATRHAGEWNFTSKPAHYNISIGSHLVRHDSGAVSATGAPSLNGFAEIRHAF